ncbi:MAG: ABC transporter ATP-binding protein [Candidatus Woesearchaeota archaeon]
MSLQVQGVSKQYQRKYAVDDVSFSVKAGSIVALLGSNGAGKSTTIKMICGLIKPTKGSLTIFDTTYQTNGKYIRQNLGYIPEESALYEDVGMLDYLDFFSSVYAITKARIKLKQLCKELDLPYKNAQLGTFSKGMKRKVLLIRAVLHDPQLLVLDEPASGLDPQSALVILDWLKKQKEKGTCIVFSSHNLSHVQKIADTIILLDKGKKIFDGDVQSFVHRPLLVTFSQNEKIKKVHCTTKELENYIREGASIIEIQAAGVEDAFFSRIQ